MIRNKWLWAALFAVPAVELFGFIYVSSFLGAPKTLLIMLATSVIGLLMMRFEGKKVLQDSRTHMQEGRVPGRTMLDGLCIFFGGLLLILPGFVMDLIGFTLVFPLTRPLYRVFLLKWIEKKMKNGNFTFYRR
ncbi:FxsA family protein [Paenibacillus sp. FSL R7-0297]|uniref:FxsA family protein n=1 Tax=unclassified Paenibacillus TaxID=185978 RepID=UPI0004F81825|nr:FxsA family protein [Paenibacillus sp. FSL R5-0912]AIQ40482.1 exlusion protein FxsA [Paenibacillus sp. FSL R5-0912]